MASIDGKNLLTALLLGGMGGGQINTVGAVLAAKAAQGTEKQDVLTVLGAASPRSVSGTLFAAALGKQEKLKQDVVQAQATTTTLQQDLGKAQAKIKTLEMSGSYMVREVLQSYTEQPLGDQQREDLAQLCEKHFDGRINRHKDSTKSVSTFSFDQPVELDELVRVVGAFLLSTVSAGDTSQAAEATKAGTATKAGAASNPDAIKQSRPTEDSDKSLSK